jgi:hypothetical protein
MAGAFPFYIFHQAFSAFSAFCFSPTGGFSYGQVHNIYRHGVHIASVKFLAPPKRTKPSSRMLLRRPGHFYYHRGASKHPNAAFLVIIALSRCMFPTPRPPYPEIHGCLLGSNTRLSILPILGLLKNEAPIHVPVVSLHVVKCLKKDRLISLSKIRRPLLSHGHGSKMRL